MVTAPVSGMEKKRKSEGKYLLFFDIFFRIFEMKHFLRQEICWFFFKFKKALKKRHFIDILLQILTAIECFFYSPPFQVLQLCRLFYAKKRKAIEVTTIEEQGILRWSALSNHWLTFAFPSNRLPYEQLIVNAVIFVCSQECV